MIEVAVEECSRARTGQKTCHATFRWRGSFEWLDAGENKRIMREMRKEAELEPGADFQDSDISRNAILI